MIITRRVMAVVKDPIQHGCGEDRVPHHLCPFRDLLVRRKDDRAGFVGITYKGEEAVGLGPADRCIADLIQYDQLSLPDVLQPEAGRALCLCGIQDLYEVGHAFKADGIAVLDGLQSESGRDHRLAKPRGTGKYDVGVGIYLVELLQLPDLTFRIDDALVEKKTMTLVYYPCGLAEGACVIPDGIVKIGDRAFMDCAGLTDITIPDSVVEIGNYAFSFCHGLTDVEIPSSVKKIGEFAFSDCSRLTSVTIPDSVAEIGEKAFYGNKKLTLDDQLLEKVE